MKSIKLITVVWLFLLLIAGCASTNKSHIYSPVGITISTEMTADVKVDLSKKLTGTASATYVFGFIKISGNSKYVDGYGGFGQVGRVKAAAAYNAISRGSGDILVSPQYIVKTDKQLIIKTIQVTVSGFEGKIKEIKNK